MHHPDSVRTFTRVPRPPRLLYPNQYYHVLNRANRSAANGDINNFNDFGRDINEQRRRQMEFSLKLIF